MANGNGNGNGLTAGAVITICLAMLVASNGIMFWGLGMLKEQIDEKASDRYTGTEARKDQTIIESHISSLEWRVQQMEQFVKDHRAHERRIADVP